MIPKIIHYCWFGNTPKPDIVKHCITSWRKYCVGWEIKEWNEANFDVESIPYMKEAYEQKKYAFVSDVARLLIVYQSGGVYLDTDVELLGSIEPLLENEAFFAFESNRNINTGLGFGAISNHKAIKKMLEFYKEKYFVVNNKMCLMPCPAGNSESLSSLYSAFKRDGQSQQFSNISILGTSEYSRIAKHHEAGTWLETSKAVNRKYKDFWIKRLLRAPEKFDFIEKHFNKRIVELYTFFVYDLLEYGVIYYLKKLLLRRRDKRVK